MSTYVNVSALWKIVVVGLLAGAGLPALFAVGLRSLSLGVAADGPETDRVVGTSPAGIAFAAVCFAVVLAAIGYGIYLIVAG